MVIDLESDGNNISEFAFFYEGDIRSYEGEEQLPSLLRRIKDQQIIVGHNIKEWDIPILEPRGFSTSAFIWDTLEIELLLNPRRYGYSLLATHKASEDVELTNKLFLNQLYRLAQYPNLCTELKSFLPSNIEELLLKLNTSPYCEFFESEVGKTEKFFKDRLPLSEHTKKQLEDLVNHTSAGRILVLAPKTLWPELALYLPLSFPFLKAEERWEYGMISQELVESASLDDPLSQAILLRFCAESATPIIANIPRYLRYQENSSSKLAFDDALLDRFSVEANGPIDCVDFEIFEHSQGLAEKYVSLVVIGLEAQDRLHKVQLGSELSFDQVRRLEGNFSFRMAATDCVYVSQAEFKDIFEPKFPELQGAIDADTANIWLERNLNGSYTLYKNYFFAKRLERLKAAFSTVFSDINWQIVLPERVNPPIALVCAKGQFFQGAEVRVTSTSPYRADYWAAQVALLRQIHKHEAALPLVYL
ncbi:MAG: hypothetical protein IJU40_01380, partial [Desulfovibrionaceae bacterium]|nr:hypothetical protein [Desulfovibrionaceae bacterium]